MLSSAFHCKENDRKTEAVVLHQILPETGRQPGGNHSEGSDGEADSSDTDDVMLDPSPTFMDTIDFVCETFPEAHGPTLQDTAPLLLGMQHGEVPATTPSLKQAQPIDLLMSQASKALADANESTKPSFAKYPGLQILAVTRVEIIWLK